MEIQVRCLGQAERFNERFTLQRLLKEFSSEAEKKIAAGELGELFFETLYSLNNEICVMWADKEAIGLYVGTIKSTFLHRVLYVDTVLVSQYWRDENLAKTFLVPHMLDLAREKRCSSVELTASGTAGQALYLSAGFDKEATKAFRYVL